MNESNSEREAGKRDASREHSVRTVKFHFNRALPQILSSLRCTLLVSTYQAGKLIAVSAEGEHLRVSVHHFEKAMGLAVRRDAVAVGTATEVLLLRSVPDVASQIEPRGRYDECFVARSSFVTGNIHVHEMAWSGEELWIVNTLFSCLSTLHEDFSFVPRWRPPFITELAAEDRCHINGLAMDAGNPRFVTALASTNEPGGWRSTKADGGCVIDISSGAAVAGGLAMPHSPRCYNEELWVLESGRGSLANVDTKRGQVESVCQLPGYTRGLAFAGPYAFVGLSRIRESAVFGGVPIAMHKDELKCGIATVDTRTGKLVATLQFESGVEEIFDVQIVPDVCCPAFVGPSPTIDDTKPVWVVPSEDQLPQITGNPVKMGLAKPSRKHRTSNKQLPTISSSSGNNSSVELFNRGNQHLREDRFAEAVAMFQSAIASNPVLDVGHLNHGLANHYMMRLDTAQNSFERALQISPDFADAHVANSMLLLHSGQWREGWAEYEWRWQCDGFGHVPIDIEQLGPAWDGSPLDECSILVYPEQGIGDEIMFSSCLPDLIAAARQCTVIARPRLVPLLSRSFPGVPIHSDEIIRDPKHLAALGRFDFQVAIGSLPRFFRPDDSSFPNRRKYLLADREKRRQWQTRLDSLGSQPKIGIAWRGGRQPEEARRRSIPLSNWESVLRNNGVQFVSLQHGRYEEELMTVTEQLGASIHHSKQIVPLEDLDTFAALIAELDLVITIDNSTAHLAGALGIDVWMAIPAFSASGWRWIINRDQSPWYPSMRVFRKSVDDDWRHVLDCIAAELVDRFQK